MGGKETCLGTNLTNVGSTLLGVTKEDDVTLIICENGIWIPKE